MNRKKNNRSTPSWKIVIIIKSPFFAFAYDYDYDSIFTRIYLECVCIIICLPYICSKEQPLIHKMCVSEANIGSVARDNVRNISKCQPFNSLSFSFHTYRSVPLNEVCVCLPSIVQTHVRVQMCPLPGIRPPALSLLLLLCPFCHSSIRSCVCMFTTCNTRICLPP